MDDRVHGALTGNRRQPLAIPHVALDDRDGRPGPFKHVRAHGAPVVADGLVPVLDQVECRERADEPAAAGDQDARGHPLRPLTVIPFTKKFWNRKKITTIGMIDETVAAISVG